MSHRRGLFGGIAVLSGGTVVLQIALFRLYSAIFGHHFAFLAISLSLFGAGLGAVLLHVFPGIAAPPRLLARLAYLATGASASTVGALVVLLHMKPMEVPGAAALGSLSLLYLSSSVAFVMVGIAVAAAIRHAARQVGQLYLLDLAGAAAGSLGAIAALRAGAPRACLIVAILDAIAAIVFYLGARRSTLEPLNPAPEERAHGGVVAAAALATAVLLAGDIGSPWLKLPSLRWAPMDKVEFQA